MPSQNEPYEPVWFYAPDSVCEMCEICRLVIQPGQLVGEFDDDWIHEDCYQERIQEMREPYEYEN